MTFKSSREHAEKFKRRVGMVLHEGYIVDSVGKTALKPEHAVTALMTDAGELYVETHGKVFLATSTGMELVEKPEKHLRSDLKTARDIYTSRASG